ncbi:MAG: type I glyceraldehyde-3-phosphate dehydrogenase [Parcubacteria group bacterium]|nr:type I glyceraldehyde-3-phosphate dehydrogenase [Parcubacteria group bacterium]
MPSSQKRRIAINGFGRIGRAAFKIALERKNLDVAAINDLTDPATLAHLLQYDTVYGRYGRPVSASAEKPFKHKDCQGGLTVGSITVPVFSQKEPGKLPWKKLGVDVVIESTGFFTSAEQAKPHLKAGAKRVVISAPAKDEQTPTLVVGVNAGDGSGAKIVSNASCTTNCIAPVAAVVHSRFGIEKAMMTTVHSYTADQNLVDGPHKDLRRARAAAANIVPTTTGAAIATAKTIPELSHRFDGIALRVPTICGSLSDLTMVTSRDVTVEEVNDAFRQAAEDPRWRGILAVTREPLVSSDIIGDEHSAIVDLSFTQVVGGNLVKVLAWYDNELGYAARLVDLVEELAI